MKNKSYKNKLYALFLLTTLLFPSCSDNPKDSSSKSNSSLDTSSLSTGSTSSSQHIHQYGEWTDFDEYNHIRVCSCGDTESSAHVYNNNYYKDEYTHTRTCTICGHQEVSDHTFDAGTVTKKPTCTETGVKKFVCSTCGYEMLRVIPLANHDYQTTVIPPSCLLDGYTEHKCSHCYDTYVDNYVPATGHSYSNTYTYDETYHWFGATCEHTSETTGKEAHQFTSAVIEEPTSDKEGTRRYTCSKCLYYYDEAIPILVHVHNYSLSWSSDASAHWHQCDGCDEKGSYALHNFNQGEIIESPTHIKKGSIKYTCLTCEYSYIDEIPMENHNYIPTVTPPTCSSFGYTTYTCSCGDSYIDDYVNKLPHTFGDWVIVTYAYYDLATFTLIPGIKKRTCSICGAFEETDNWTQKGELPPISNN